jgi:hypothetical protein
MMNWQTIGESVKTIGDVVGVTGGGLGICNTISSRCMQRRRLRQEKTAKAIDQRADDLRRCAHEVATSLGSGGYANGHLAAAG